MQNIDVVFFTTIVLGNIFPEFNYYINCDINNDSLINITDIISIINMIISIISSRIYIHPQLQSLTTLSFDQVVLQIE